jgi:hypothetical protein
MTTITATTMMATSPPDDSSKAPFDEPAAPASSED